MNMTRSLSWPIMIIAVSLAVVGGMALAAQDKYTLQVPDGLRSLTSGDTKTGRLSPSVKPKNCSR